MQCVCNIVFRHVFGLANGPMPDSCELLMGRILLRGGDGAFRQISAHRLVGSSRLGCRDAVAIWHHQLISESFLQVAEFVVHYKLLIGVAGFVISHFRVDHHSVLFTSRNKKHHEALECT